MYSTLLLDRLERLHPERIDLSLDRMERLLRELGHPERRLPPTIHVAGTNGKGSTIAFVRAMAEAMGGSVHVYTSPHLTRFHERIVLAGSPISENNLVRCLERVESVNDGQPITSFEITTAAAFLAFSETPADLLLLETGLGGRLDATNVVSKPRVTAITPVSIDHVSFLGDSIGAIAGEKAGILKPDVTCVVGRQDKAALDAIARRAREIGAPLQVFGEGYAVSRQGDRMVYEDAVRRIELPFPHLTGQHQLDNAAVAIATAAVAFGDALTPSAVERGMTGAVWPARLQRLSLGPLHAYVGAGTEIWLDGGHNVGASRAIAKAMGASEPSGLHLILGMMVTKDAAAALAPFKNLVSTVYAVPIPNEENAYSAESLASLASAGGFNASVARSVPEALRMSQAASGGPRHVLIFGSLYLAGHVLELHSTERSYFTKALSLARGVPTAARASGALPALG